MHVAYKSKKISHFFNSYSVAPNKHLAKIVKIEPNHLLSNNWQRLNCLNDTLLFDNLISMKQMCTIFFLSP